MSSHHMSADQVISMVVEQAIYPITVDVLYSIFGPFGVEQLVVYPPTKSDDGEPCVAADVRFRSAHAAAHAMAYWDGRYIYYRCCRLQMWNATWNATADIRPAPTSPPAPMAAPDPPSPPPSQETTTEESAPVPDVSCPTTTAQEVLKVIHDASPAYITRAPVTCLTDGLNQVVTTAIVKEVRDAATRVCPEPAAGDKEVEQLTPARATSSIGSDTTSITKEVVPPMAITTDVDPKYGVQEGEALTLVEATADALSQRVFLVTSEVFHVVDTGDFATPALVMCSTNCSTNLLRYVLHPRGGCYD